MHSGVPCCDVASEINAASTTISIIIITFYCSVSPGFNWTRQHKQPFSKIGIGRARAAGNMDVLITTLTLPDISKIEEYMHIEWPVVVVSPGGEGIFFLSLAY